MREQTKSQTIRKNRQRNKVTSIGASNNTRVRGKNKKKLYNRQGRA